jgi:hypothetical protein
MIVKTLLVAALLALAACGKHATSYMVDPDVLRAQRASYTAALTKQLEDINYPAIVTHEGETVMVRVGQVRDFER